MRGRRHEKAIEKERERETERETERERERKGEGRESRLSREEVQKLAAA